MDAETKQGSLAALYQASVAAYQASAPERRRLAAEWRDRDEVSPLDDLEVLATDLSGYMSQLIHTGTITSPGALQHLRALAILKHPSIAQLARSSAAEYPHLMRYLELLEQLRREGIVQLEENEPGRSPSLT